MIRLYGIVRDERGVTAVLIGIAMLVLIGAAALAIDAGSLWSTRRSLITDTDAAALAAARVLVQEPCDTIAARSEAIDVLKANDADTVMIEFQVTFLQGLCTTRAGKVRVAAEHKPTLAFGPVLGADPADTFVRAASLAHYGNIVSAPGLWPIAICDQNLHVQEWIAANTSDSAMTAYQLLKGTDNPATPYYDHPPYSAAGVTHRVLFTKQDDEQGCGDKASGNWGWTDYDGDPGGGANDISKRLLQGYEGEVDLGSSGRGDEDCEPHNDGEQWCRSETGAKASSQDELNEIRCAADIPAENCQYQYPIIFYSESAGGGGANERYHHVGFTGVVIRGFAKVTGQGAGGAKCDDLEAEECPHFDFEFTSLIWEGKVGPPTSDPNPLLGAQLCGVEYAGETNDNCFF